MSKMGNSIIQGLQEALEYVQGKPIEGGKVYRMSVSEVDSFTPSEIKQTRLNANMTQRMFAMVIGVTPKSVEAWEGGRSKPDGAARRVIGLMAKNPKFADEVGIVIR